MLLMYDNVTNKDAKKNIPTRKIQRNFFLNKCLPFSLTVVGFCCVSAMVRPFFLMCRGFPAFRQEEKRALRFNPLTYPNKAVIAAGVMAGNRAATPIVAGMAFFNRV